MVPSPEKIRFDNRVVVITGAGGGLGRIYALEFAKRGAALVINDLGGPRDGTGSASTSPADKVAAEITSLGGRAVANYDSVASEEGGKSIVKQALESFGRIDVLINNAGILRDKTLVKLEPADWNSVLDVHLTGAYHTTKPALIKMREQNYGRIMFATSAAGLYGNFGQSNYSAAKLGLVGLMNTLKLECRKNDVTVNAVAPIAATRLTEDVLPPEIYEMLMPEQVTPLVLYLCWEGCSETGMIFNAGMGYFNRAAIVTGKGIRVGNGKDPMTPEQILEKWENIKSLQGGSEHSDATEALGDMLYKFNVQKPQ
jgi:NAD(P)-dependent dehydrogenase (short-subunit alcohol dehydrogenase family)